MSQNNKEQMQDLVNKIGVLDFLLETLPRNHNDFKEEIVKTTAKVGAGSLGAAGLYQALKSLRGD